MTIKKQLGNKLIDLRKASKYSQDGISELLGISQSKYSRIESGKNDIDIIAFGKLLDLYGVTFPEVKKAMLLPKQEHHQITS